MSVRRDTAFLCLIAGVVVGAPGAPVMSETHSTGCPPSLPANRLLPPDERLAGPPRTLDTHRAFPTFYNRAEWEKRRAFIRNQVLLSCGLNPMPPKTPLRARVTDRIERDGYTIEKVSLQTHPGFYLAGNLYRPRAKPGGHVAAKHPGVLVAHGHWRDGRMANTPEGSIPARAITFARQGYVAFTYDMVGYNDTRQIDHKFANDREHWLWGISLMGLQTWNSIRALDFLTSLPDVDTTRLAITGESGGGTQTMMLGAIEERLAAVGPCVMVSHTMQGGCLCENAPGLRIAFSNVELAAAAAPRAQIMVGASGDWTSTMMTMEGPSVERIYRLYGAPERLRYVLFNYNHNINKTSREAVYSFFGEQLLHDSNVAHFLEPPYTMEPADALRVFPPDRPMPADACSAADLKGYLMRLARQDLEQRRPRNRQSLTAFQKTYRPIWEHTLAAEIPSADRLRHETGTVQAGRGFTVEALDLGRIGRGDHIPALLFRPERREIAAAFVLAHPDGKSAWLSSDPTRPGSMVRALLERGCTVLILDAFLTGERADPSAAERRKPFLNYFTTYNRTDLQERVQDLATACASLRSLPGVRTVTLIGQGKAGLWALLAAPAADAVSADCAQLDLTTDEALLTDELFVPCLRRMGDFYSSAVLAAPHRLLLHNTGARFTAAGKIREVYSALGASQALHIAAQPVSQEELVTWAAAPR